MTEYMLTTVDNEIDPFDNFDAWYTKDLMLARKNERLDCCSYLAQVMNSSPFVSEEQSTINGNEAIDWIIRNDTARTVDGAKVYMRVGRELNVKTAHRPDWDNQPVYR